MDIIGGYPRKSAPNDDYTRKRVQGILVRLQRYVRGYLPNSRIEADEDFSKNPAEVTIKVWWRDERGQGSQR
jgi:hypothetical protein